MSDRIDRFIETMKVQPDDRILEIGCGHGVAAALICEKLSTGHYLGLDRSAKMIAAAVKRNAASIDAGRAEFVLGDVESCDLGAQRFDKILAMRVRLFHHAPDEAHRLASGWLAPDGKLFVQYDEPFSNKQDAL